VKGAFIIAGYSLVLLIHFLASWLGSETLQQWLIIPGIPLSVMTAVYTAYLFAQAKARDMWQNPLLPPHLLVQALLLGSALLLLCCVWLEETLIDVVIRTIDTARPETGFLLWVLAISTLIHLLMLWGEVSVGHPTAHARLAIWEMVFGRYKSDFWIGTALSILGGVLPALAIFGLVSASVGVAGAPLALVGLMLFENAYVQAGQSVPLA
jgi:Ni/Fe-hydrogenase subunit HybB-like protein